MIHYKANQTTQAKITPSESDLAIIQAFALAGEPINPEDLFVGRMSLANDQYDRSHERFPESYLIQFARTMPGKSVMTGHDYSRDPAGRIYKAEVTASLASATERGVKLGKELVVSYYLLNTDPLAAKVKAGIAKDVSIGFNPDLRLCDLCEKDYDGWMKGEDDACSHVAGKDYEDALARVTYGGDVAKVEGLEGSFVWLGCQYGAQAIAAMRAFSPQAKAAYFDSQAGKGVWAFPEINLQRFGGSIEVSPEMAAVYKRLGAQEKPMHPEIEKGAPPPTEAKLTPEQERLIALGKAYELFVQTHIKGRYGACGMERTGERLAAGIPRASVEEIAEEIKAADETFNEKFPGKGLGVPASDTAAEPVPERKFNPLRRQLTRI